ncbi:MFS transporter [uncultured Kriegella sp.]|uniref:CynX/NimT family MFS transporter n=1 Tax=uncultured Kriegella sp. TaxID=1798910 RepID=UPI0030D9BAEB|tara:strand:+ start:144829 stop:146022 length:1194 start_codon:yes stop_codon:yes gene_type:complete
MPKSKSGNKGQRSINVLLLAGILCIAFNLRPALAGVGPLISDIREATGLSNAMLGLLTTLPLMAFGVFSTLTPLFTRRFGIGGTLFGAMLLLVTGIVIRSLGGVYMLYLGTLLFGIAIAFGNVLLPSLTKRNFAANSGLVTSLYSSLMAAGASLAAGISVPLAHEYKLGWRFSLGVWAIVATVALMIWLPQLSRLKKANQKRNYLEAMKTLGQSRLAWNVALFMGLQSLTFYVVLAWLPAILQSRGFDAEFSGWMLSLSQATGILGSLTIPIFAGRQRDQRAVVLFLVIIEIIGLAGLLFPQIGWVPLWVSLIGLVLGGTFGLALLFIVLRSQDADTATELSGMAQSIGYIIAATGPLIFGSIFDFTGSWAYSLVFLFIIAFLKLYMGLGAGKHGKV